MAEMKPQTYAHHGRFVPLFHYVLSLLLVIYLGWTVWKLYLHFSGDNLISLMVAVALLLLFYYTRAFPLHVQDRLIRLEERLRLARVLPAELAGRVGELTPDQLIGLRFAPDEELPDLVKRVLAGELTERRQIKRAIRTWRPDHYRC